MKASERSATSSVQGRSGPRAGDRFLSAQELAEWLDVPVATLYFWRYKGNGPKAYRLGKHLRYRRSDVEAWLRTVEDEPN